MENKNIIVSVCMITYNHENFIAEAIEGVMMQTTGFPVELVIGEDCSTDNTRNICLGYKEKYPDKIRLLLPEKNLGMTQNFINTLQACTGKYIAICEGDDYWTDPLKLQKQVDFLEAHPDYGLVATKFSILDNHNLVNWEMASEECDFSFENFLQHNRIGTLTACFVRNLVIKYENEINPVSKHWNMGDSPLWLYISANSKVKYIPDVTAVYRVLPNSASRSNNLLKNYIFELNTLEIRDFFANKYNKSSLIADDCNLNYTEVLYTFYSEAYFEKTDFLKRKIYACGKVNTLTKIRLWGLKNKMNYVLSKTIIKIYKNLKF